MNPKVFICHATEDKERFVRNFAEKLMTKGVDVWLDEWEMFVGDSLVDRIFEEGIKSAKIMIVILSKNSVKKPWVREEINVGFVNRINKKIKLMPIIIDNCETPECLNTTIWQRIKNIDDYESELNKIIASIFGTTNKPKIGQMPKYTQTVVDLIGGLNELDSLLFKEACEMAVEEGIKMVTTQRILDRCIKAMDISNEHLLESLDILDELGYIKLGRNMGGPPPFFTITDSGFEDYSRTYVEDYSNIYSKIAYYVANNPQSESIKISEEMNQPTIIVENVLIHLKNRNLIKIVQDSQGISVFHTSASLKRELANNE